MTDAYDLRSNIKGKPGSQGTLFKVKDKGLLNPDQRWPQGYTPERLNAVRDATRDIRISPALGDGHSVGELQSDHSRERFNRTVARSTIPTSDLQGIREVDSRAEATHAATYYPAARRIGIRPELPDHDKNLIHEIGHHVDFSHARQAETLADSTRGRIPDIARAHVERTRGIDNPNSTQLANAVRDVTYGAREGYADNYYTDHYREPGRKGGRVSTGRYEANFPGPGEIERRYPGYRDVRPASHMGPQF